MSLIHQFVQPQAKGVIALPAALRRKLRLDEPGVQVEITERPDGVIELRASAPVPIDEVWFWERRWQEGERAVDAHVAAGRVTTFEDDAAFLDAIDG